MEKMEDGFGVLILLMINCIDYTPAQKGPFMSKTIGMMNYEKNLEVF